MTDSRPRSGELPEAFSVAARVVALAVLIVVGWLALRTVEPHAEATGPARGFDLDRAMTDVAFIASEPHPTGSAAQDHVRQYLLAQIRDAGLSADVQESVVVLKGASNQRRMTRVRNVIGRLEGTGGGKAVMLAAHYDSVTTGPGAGDDTAGVAALLETMRVMAAGPRPKRDLVFLFTDGEELGLLGSRAFVESGRADNVGWVVNVEGRGAAGASLMFETLPGNVSVMRFFGETSPQPVASSYGYDVYKRMPNDTDFTEFRKVIPAGFNFAFIEDPAAYHASVDTPARLSRASLEHHGVQALALARRLSESPPAETGVRAAYFSLPLAGLVVYPAWWDGVGAFGCVMLGLLVLAVGIRRRWLRPAGLGASLLVAVVATAAAVLLLVGLRWLWAGPLDHARDSMGVLATLVFAWIAVTAGVIWLVALTAARRLGVLNLAAAVAALWTVLAVAVAWLLGSSAFLFTWPALFAWLGLLLLVWKGPGTPSWLAALAFACGLPVLLFWLPTLKMTGLALGPAPAILGGAAALPALLMVLPVAQLSGTRPGRLWGSVALAAGLSLFAFAAVTAGPTADHPRSDSLVYAVDTSRGESFWASWDDEPDAYTVQVLGEAPERRKLPAFFGDQAEVMTAPARGVPLAPPLILVKSNEPFSGGQRITLSLQSPRGATVMEVDVRPQGKLRRASVDGHYLDVDGPFHLTYQALPEFGIDMTLEVNEGTSLVISVVDGSYGLPVTVAPNARPPGLQRRRNPPQLHERRFPVSDVTMVRSRRLVQPGDTY